jgi:hypothetical protein
MTPHHPSPARPEAWRLSWFSGPFTGLSRSVLAPALTPGWKPPKNFPSPVRRGFSGVVFRLHMKRVPLAFHIYSTAREWA